MSRTFSKEEKETLKELIREGVSVTGEIEALRGGLSDTIASVAEELEIKTAVLKRVIKLAATNTFDSVREDIDSIEEILMATQNLSTGGDDTKV